MTNVVLWIQKILGLGVPCMFQTLTGLYCPGCGGTRAVRTLLRGELLLSLQYHPLVIYMAVVGFYEIASWLVAKIRHKPFDHFKKQRMFIIIGSGIVLINWFYKNYMLVVRGIDLLPVFQ